MYIIQYKSISKIWKLTCYYTIAMINSWYELEIRINNKCVKTIINKDIKYLTAYALWYVSWLKNYHKCVGK